MVKNHLLMLFIIASLGLAGCESVKFGDGPGSAGPGISGPSTNSDGKKSEGGNCLQINAAIMLVTVGTAAAYGRKRRKPRK
jgi:uncharacterized protein YceK